VSALPLICGSTTSQSSDQMFTRSGGKRLNARREKRSANAPSATPSSDLDHETKETVDGSGVLD
jgi:hypothetical protein